MRIHLAALAAGMLALVAGCQTIKAVSGFTVTQGQVDAARSSYDAAFLAPAAHYRQLPLCTSGQTFLRNQCAERSVILTLQSADRTVEASFDRVQAMVTAGNNTGLVAAYQTLTTAIQTAEGITISLGIN
jgi:hypothetical protein